MCVLLVNMQKGELYGQTDEAIWYQDQDNGYCAGGAGNCVHRNVPADKRAGIFIIIPERREQYADFCP